MTADLELLRPVEPPAVIASTKPERRRQMENVALNHCDRMLRIQRRAYAHHRDAAVWLEAVEAEIARAAAQLQQIAEDWS